MNKTTSESSSTPVFASLSASKTANEDKGAKNNRSNQALPKTGEEDSSLGMAFGALLTATGLVYFAKGKRNDEEGEDY